MFGFKLEENWALSTLWVCVSVKNPTQAEKYWRSGLGTLVELRPFCALLCSTLTLLRRESAVWQPGQRNSESGLCLWLCRGDGASRGAEQGSASPGAQNTKALGFHFPLEDTARTPQTPRGGPARPGRVKRDTAPLIPRAFCAAFKELTVLLRFCQEALFLWCPGRWPQHISDCICP